MMRVTAALALGLLLFTPPAAFAAPADADRLRVGLVLGGGGARGAAHIGVLKELERQRIPIDAIAGTSMGAIVGGLYATGMSANELEELINSLDWAAALSDQPERQDLSFRRKQDDREFPVQFELGVRGTDLVLPQGVIKGQKLDLLLRELTRHAHGARQFDDLPIPFRAVATDIVSGEAVVLGDGDLAAAIRASMSVPGAFTPAQIDGRLLVDGGIVGNLPIDVIRSMNVDVVIAVDVEFPLYKEDELESVLSVSEQVLTILMRKETQRQIETLEDRDVLIRPQLGTFASSNFGQIGDAVQPGIEAATRQSGKLSPLSMAEAEWRNYLAGRRSTTEPGGRLAFVRIEHDGTLADSVLEARLDVAPGDPIDTRRLAENANRLYGLRLYEQVSYELVDEDGQTGVVYRAQPKSWGPSYLQFGMTLEDDLDGSTAFSLAARHTRSGINRLGAEWRTDLKVGTDSAISTEFYQPLSIDSRYFLAPRLEWQQSNFNIYSDDRRLARYRLTDGVLSLDAGRELGNIGELRVGAFRGVGDARVKVGDPSLQSFDFETGGVFGRLRFDTVDNANFPRHGFLADIQWTMSRPDFGGDSDYDIVEADISHTWSRGKSSLQLGLGYATTIRSNDALQDFFPLGGFLRLSGLERGEIAGPHAGLLRAVYYRRVGSQTAGIFDTPVYLGASIESGSVWQSRGDIGFSSMQLNGSLFAGVDTFFGPLFLAAGFAEQGRSNVYLFIGSPPR